MGITPADEEHQDRRNDVTCLMSAILGNRIMSRRIVECVDLCIRGSSHKIWFDADSYRNHPAPKWLRSIAAIESEFVARRMLKGRRLSDTIVINGIPLAMAVASSGHRLIVATDSTLAMSRQMIESQSFAKEMIRQAFDRIQDRRFSQLVRRVSAWLPMSETCKRSLVEHYGVDPSRCHVTNAPQPTFDPSSVRTELKPPFELLFVGNDFQRKGGPALVAAIQSGLLKDCKLTIVSNDPAAQAQHRKGVSVIQGITDPREIQAAYRKAHLLLLPTNYDMYSNVICEGLTFGLPFLATPVGGIRDLLIDSFAGWELPKGATPDQISNAVIAALQNEQAYIARSRAALDYAERHLQMDKLQTIVARVLAD